MGLFVVLVLMASSSIVRAQCSTTTWIRNGTGDWFTDTNWSNQCLPSDYVDASINDGGTAQILIGVAIAQSLKLGDNQGNSGHVLIDGTSLSGALGVYPHCESNTGGEIYVGKAGSGSLTITNGGSVFSGHAYIASVANPTRPASNGVVNMYGVVPFGPGSSWVISSKCSGGAGLFIGCTATTDSGGIALVDIGFGALIQVDNTVDAPSVKVGLSGKLKGIGVLRQTGPTPQSQTTLVLGTLAPQSLTIEGNLNLKSPATMVYNVTQQAWDNIYVSNATGGGNVHLGGRLSVTMSGDFTSDSFLLLHADAGLNGTFDSTSVVYNTNPGSPCIKPVIAYDVGNVYLNLEPCF